MARTTGNAKDLITFTRASTGTFLGSNGLLQTAAINTPRVEYDANGVAKGLLIEEQRTNLVTYSEDFTTSWTPLNATITSSAAVAPNGTTTADTLLGSAAVDTHAVRVAITTVTSTQYAASCWFKKQNYSKCGVVILSGTWQHVTYDFDADTLTTYGGATAKRETYGDFVRVTLLFSAGSTTTNLYLGPSSGIAVNNPLAFNAAGVELTLWGAQLEVGSFPTSYIPTSGATATRSADIASVSVSEFGYNQAQGSVVVEFSSKDDDPSPFSISDGTAANRMLSYVNSSNIRWYILNGAASQANVASSVSYNTDTNYKAASVYAANDFAISVNGELPQIDSAGFVPTSVSLMNIGTSNSGGGPLNGHIKSLNYYPLRLSDAKLQSLTS